MYFAEVMVCLMLVLAPVMCILAAIAVSSSLSTYMKYLDSSSAVGSSRVQPKDAKSIKVEAVLKVKTKCAIWYLAKGYIERPSALFGTWQKDTVRNQMCYTVPGKKDIPVRKRKGSGKKTKCNKWHLAKGKTKYAIWHLAKGYMERKGYKIAYTSMDRKVSRERKYKVNNQR